MLIKHPKNNINFHPEILIKEIPLGSKEWFNFISELSDLEIACWKDNYYDNEVCDGTQWELIIRQPNQIKISKSRSYEYPPFWNKFIKNLKNYFGEKID